MNNNCKYYRTRTEKGIKYGYCLKDKKKVPLFCKECEEYKKTIEEKIKASNNKPLKNKFIYLNLPSIYNKDRRGTSTSDSHYR